MFQTQYPVCAMAQLLQRSKDAPFCYLDMPTPGLRLRLQGEAAGQDRPNNT